MIGQGTKDDFGHGTHVADRRGRQNNGTEWPHLPQLSIMSVKVLDATGSGYLSDIANGIVYAADHAR
jgi:thermitase